MLHSATRAFTHKSQPQTNPSSGLTLYSASLFSNTVFPTYHPIFYPYLPINMHLKFWNTVLLHLTMPFSEFTTINTISLKVHRFLFVWDMLILSDSSVLKRQKLYLTSFVVSAKAYTVNKPKYLLNEYTGKREAWQGDNLGFDDLNDNKPCRTSVDLYRECMSLLLYVMHILDLGPVLIS